MVRQKADRKRQMVSRRTNLQLVIIDRKLVEFAAISRKVVVIDHLKR